MMGTEEEPGIIPLTVNEIFRQIELNEDREFLIRVGYIEIYNEKIFDLLVDLSDPNQSNDFAIIEDKNAKGLYFIYIIFI